MVRWDGRGGWNLEGLVEVTVGLLKVIGWVIWDGWTEWKKYMGSVKWFEKGDCREVELLWWLELGSVVGCVVDVVLT